MGSESITTEVGAARLTQVAVGPPVWQLLANVINNVSRSDWKFVTPLASFGGADFQFTPIDGSPAPRPMYSTVGPVLTVTGVRTPGASKFSYPTFGPVSAGAGGGGLGVSGTTVAVP